MLFADCDLGASLSARRFFDAVGHYSREETLGPLLASPPAGRAKPAGGPASEAPGPDTGPSA
jgi:hypothetical protein